MSKITSSFIINEVFNILCIAAQNLLKLNSQSRSSSETDRGSLRLLLELCDSSEVKEVREFSSKCREDCYQISNLIENLNTHQQENFLTILKYYEDSLTNVKGYEPEEQIEYYLSLSYHIVQDVLEYLVDYEKLVRKKSEENIHNTLQEVDQLATSFCLY